MGYRDFIFEYSRNLASEYLLNIMENGDVKLGFDYARIISNLDYEIKTPKDFCVLLCKIEFIDFIFHKFPDYKLESYNQCLEKAIELVEDDPEIISKSIKIVKNKGFPIVMLDHMDTGIWLRNVIKEKNNKLFELTYHYGFKNFLLKKLGASEKPNFLALVMLPEFTSKFNICVENPELLPEANLLIRNSNRKTRICKWILIVFFILVFGFCIFKIASI